MKRIDEQLKMKNIGPTAELKRIPDPITVWKQSESDEFPIIMF